MVRTFFFMDDNATRDDVVARQKCLGGTLNSQSRIDVDDGACGPRGEVSEKRTTFDAREIRSPTTGKGGRSGGPPDSPALLDDLHLLLVLAAVVANESAEREGND